MTFLHIAEVDRVDASALVGDDRWFRMSEQSPGCLPEERMRLDVGSACARSESAQFVLDEEFADERFAQAI